MGDPKFPKKKYKTPSHPWQKGRIESEQQLLREFGLANKKEIWKMDSVLRGFTQQAKNLIASRSSQADKERLQMMRTLSSYGLIDTKADLDDVLGLNVHDFMERRLQTQVFRGGLANSMRQARQFIVHRHILVGETVVTSPSFLVTKDSNITFKPGSALKEGNHPVRPQPVVAAVPEVVPEVKEKKEES